MGPQLVFFNTFLLFFFLILWFPPYFAIADEQFSACEPFSCGNLTNLSYPFWFDSRFEYCGHPSFKLDCQGDNATINIASQNFRVIDVRLTTRTLTIARMDLRGTICPNEFHNITLDYAFFNYTSDNVNSTILYDCDYLEYPALPVNLSTSSMKFECPVNGSTRQAYFLMIGEKWFNRTALGCGIGITVPVIGVAARSFMEDAIDPGEVIDQGFEVKWERTEEGRCESCRLSGGRCGYNESLGGFRCFCPNQSYDQDRFCFPPELVEAPTPEPLLQQPERKGELSIPNKIIVGVVTATVVVLVMLTLFYIYRRRKRTSYAKSYIQSRTASSVSSMKIDDPEINASNYFGVPVFTYTELEEATNNFDEARELGDGGFGTVYFGKLRDGRYVAVKRLYENNYKRVEQFINEVQILTRLRHVNLVSLYGCTSRHSRELLLVYEYIPNGTVADHLHGDRAKPGSLPWHIRMNIAIETASALAYLHASDIIHRDVKTNNILLDNHFVVKVADFGLSRLFPDHVTHISTAPQGTPGYVDPEYHECYKLTDKSDVYSFGVVLIELISSLPAVDITRHRHEINLSTMAINKIQNRALHELVDPTIGFESDQKVRKMINAVAELAFQCLQNFKDMRPSMEEVVETLRYIESDGKHLRKPEVMDISADDDVGLLKNDLPPPSPDSNLASKSTTSNSSS